MMAPGDHGSTFAGNPLVCHAANAVVDIIAEPSFLEGVTQKGERLRQGLRQALGGNPHVQEVRGLGLIIGVQLDTVSQGACPCARSMCAWGQQWRLYLGEVKVNLSCLRQGQILTCVDLKGSWVHKLWGIHTSTLHSTRPLQLHRSVS